MFAPQSQPTGILTFLARDASSGFSAMPTPHHQGTAVGGDHAFRRFRQQHTGAVPAELVFDSRLTTYAQLDVSTTPLHFITLRRRTRKMLAPFGVVRCPPGNASPCQP